MSQAESEPKVFEEAESNCCVGRSSGDGERREVPRVAGGALRK